MVNPPSVSCPTVPVPPGCRWPPEFNVTVPVSTPVPVKIPLTLTAPVPVAELLVLVSDSVADAPMIVPPP